MRLSELCRLRVCSQRVAVTTQTANDREALQVVALERLVPELERLERLLDDENEAMLQALKGFAKHPDLQRLAELLKEEKKDTPEFNPFEVLGLWWQEDIHSRILTWLLGPDNTHGLGDYFVRNFLLESGVLSAFEISDYLSSTETQREWPCVADGKPGRLDILILNSDMKFLCAIENKIFAPEGGRQLTRYRRALEAEYSNFDRHYLFLSPSGIESHWQKEREFWKPICYSTILRLVEQTVEDDAADNSDAIHLFLQQYLATLSSTGSTGPGCHQGRSCDGFASGHASQSNTSQL